MKSLLSCYLEDCGKENDEVGKKFDSYNIAKKKLVYLYTNNKISKEKFKQIMSKISIYHFTSDYYRKFVKCIFKSCSKLVQKNLEKISAEITYKKLSKYTVDDFIKIMILRNKKNVIDVIVKMYAPNRRDR